MRSDEVVAGLLLHQVAREEQALASGLFDELLGVLGATGRDRVSQGIAGRPSNKENGDELLLLVREVVDRDVGAFAGKEDGDGATNARVASCDNRLLVLELVAAAVLLEVRLATVPTLNLFSGASSTRRRTKALPNATATDLGVLGERLHVGVRARERLGELRARASEVRVSFLFCAATCSSALPVRGLTFFGA